VVDGSKGLTEATSAVFPKTTVQTCIVHLIRNSLDYANCKDRKPLAQALRPICTAPSAEAAAELLEAFAAGPWVEAKNSTRGCSQPGSVHARMRPNGRLRGRIAALSDRFVTVTPGTRSDLTV
jgi:hypothetical protein